MCILGFYDSSYRDKLSSDRENNCKYLTCHAKSMVTYMRVMIMFDKHFAPARLDDEGRKQALELRRIYAVLLNSKP